MTVQLRDHMYQCVIWHISVIPFPLSLSQNGSQTVLVNFILLNACYFNLAFYLLHFNIVCVDWSDIKLLNSRQVSLMIHCSIETKGEKLVCFVKHSHCSEEPMDHMWEWKVRLNLKKIYMVTLNRYPSLKHLAYSKSNFLFKSLVQGFTL